MGAASVANLAHRLQRLDREHRACTQEPALRQEIPENLGAAANDREGTGIGRTAGLHERDIGAETANRGSTIHFDVVILDEIRRQASARIKSTDRLEQPALRELSLVHRI